MNPYSSVKLEGARWPVILSEAKNLPVQREILPLHSHSGLKASCTQNDSPQGAMKLDRVLQGFLGKNKGLFLGQTLFHNCLHDTRHIMKSLQFTFTEETDCLKARYFFHLEVRFASANIHEGLDFKARA